MVKEREMAGKRKTSNAVKKLTKSSKPVVAGEEPDPVTSVNVEPGPKTGAPVQNVDEKVRVADMERSRKQLGDLAHHSDEAVEAAGLPLEGYDKGLVAKIAAVPADGASGTVGWVVARKIAAAIRGK